MIKKFIIPAKGRLIPDLQLGDHLPPEGREVVISAYWQRRINDNDVTVRADRSTKGSKV